MNNLIVSLQHAASSPDQFQIIDLYKLFILLISCLLYCIHSQGQSIRQILSRLANLLFSPKSSKSKSVPEKISKELVPADDVIKEILFRLPPNSLQKFRSVCKSWNALIREDNLYFGAQHLQIQSKLRKNHPCIATFTCTDAKLRDYVLNYTSGQCEIDFSYEPKKRHCITNSCDGLVGVSTRDDVFYLANPSIMNVSDELPKCSPHLKFLDRHMPHAAIGLDSSAGVYKIVRVFYREYLATVQGCEVLSIGKDRSWRSIETPPLLGRKVYCKVFCMPFVVGGAVYWTLEKTKRGNKYIALSFDLREEKLCLVKRPYRMTYSVSAVAFALGGCVAVADIIGLCKIVIWTLEDPTDFIWAKKYEIDLDENE